MRSAKFWNSASYRGGHILLNPNFDNDNHNRKNRYNSGDKNNRGGRENQGRGNQGRNEGRGRRR